MEINRVKKKQQKLVVLVISFFIIKKKEKKRTGIGDCVFTFRIRPAWIKDKERL